MMCTFEFFADKGKVGVEEITMKMIRSKLGLLQFLDTILIFLTNMRIKPKHVAAMYIPKRNAHCDLGLGPKVVI